MMQFSSVIIHRLAWGGVYLPEGFIVYNSKSVVWNISDTLRYQRGIQNPVEYPCDHVFLRI